MESILTSIKKLLGIPEEYEQFDADIIMYINSVFSILTQLGVGPSAGYQITDKYSTWEEYLNDNPLLSDVKAYMCMKVRLMFDVTTLPSSVIEVYNRQIAELEWRISATVDPGNK